MDDVIDAEVVSDEATFVPDIPAHLMGWCNDGQHDRCPEHLDSRPWPDPARKGSFYNLPARRCSCACHTRPGTLFPGAERTTT